MDELPRLVGRTQPWDPPDAGLWAELASDLQEDPFTLMRLLHCINTPGSFQCLAGALRSAD